MANQPLLHNWPRKLPNSAKTQNNGHYSGSTCLYLAYVAFCTMLTSEHGMASLGGGLLCQCPLVLSFSLSSQYNLHF